MAGIEKDINYLEALCDKRPDSPCYFYLPCCRAFYEIQSDKLPSALEHLQKMERIYAKHPYPYFLLLIKYLYASYHIAAKEYTQALQSYDELLPYVKESGSYKDIQISQERAKVLSLMGRIEEACEEYEVINARKDSLDANSYLRQINELHTLYQIDKNELNNINRQKKILYWSWFIILSVLSLIIFFIFRIKRNNKRLIQSQQEQEKVKKQAENSIRTKSLFLSNMSHEIRTPLNALSGFSTILTEESIDEETRKQCNDIIQQNSELLLKLINDVIDLSSLEIGKMTFKFKICDAVGLCRNVIDMVEKIKQTHADVRFSTPLDSLELLTDSARLQQVSMQLNSPHKALSLCNLSNKRKIRHFSLSPIPAQESLKRNRKRYSTVSRSSMKMPKVRGSDYRFANSSSNSWEVVSGSTPITKKVHVSCLHILLTKATKERRKQDETINTTAHSLLLLSCRKSRL